MKSLLGPRNSIHHVGRQSWVGYSDTLGSRGKGFSLVPFIPVRRWNFFTFFKAPDLFYHRIVPRIFSLMLLR